MVSECFPAGLTKHAHPVRPLASAIQYIAAKTRKLMPLHIIPQLGVAMIFEMMNHFRRMNPRARETMPEPGRSQYHVQVIAKSMSRRVSPRMMSIEAIPGFIVCSSHQ